MELQLTSERAAFPLLTGASSRQYRDEQPLKQTEAQGEDRERRRIEFRASLMEARESFARVAGCACHRSPRIIRKLKSLTSASQKSTICGGLGT
jgi:hypothetical protein